MANLTTQQKNTLRGIFTDDTLADLFIGIHDAADVLSSTEAGYLDGASLEVTASKCVVADATGCIQYGDAVTGKIIQTGTYQSTADGGITLTSTNARPVSILGDDSGTALTGDIRQVLSRVLLTIDRTAGTVNAIRGQIKALNLIDSGAACVTAPVTGYLELVGTGARSIGGHCAAVRAALEEGASGTTTIATSSYYAGFEATLTSTRTYTTTGQMAAFMCNISGGTSVWPIGFLVDDSSCTTGIDLGTCTTGIEFSGTVTEGIVFSAATLSPGGAGGDSSRAFEIGSRTDEFTLAFAGGDGVENFEPVQMKVDVTGTNPASTSKINMIYQQLTHDTTDMASLRLKCADFTISVNKNCKDVYAYQGEIAFGAGTPTASGEVATMGLVLDGGSALTCTNCKILNLTARGAGLPANTSGLYIQSENGCTLTDGVRIQTLGTITNGLRFGNTAGTSSTCPTNMMAVPAAGSGFVANLSGGNGSDDSITFDNPVSIRILVGGVAHYLVAGTDPKSA